MSEDDAMMNERDEIEMLLPWYVTGRLSAEDKAKIDAAVRREPALARQLALVREEMSTSGAAAEAIKPPASLSVEATVAHVRARSPAHTAPFDRLVNALRDFLFKPTGGLRFAAAAALAVLCVQSAVITKLATAPTASYGTAGGGNAQSAGDATVLVRFTDGASLTAIGDLLQQRGMSIVDGPKPGGIYRVRIAASPISPADREALVSSLRKESGIVAIVLPTSGN